MQLHVQQPAGQELGGREPLVERRRALDALDQFGRDRLPGLVCSAKRFSSSGVASQCSNNCDGNSTKSRGTRVPDNAG
jgi:hypothetical protein